MNNIWNNISQDLIEMGFKIDNLFLQALSTRNSDYIRDKIMNLPIFSFSSEYIMDTSCMILKYVTNKNKVKKYWIKSYINKGTYNETFLIYNLKKRKNYVYRRVIDKVTDIKILTNNYIEGFIHSFLTCYQSLYLKQGFKNILKIHLIGYQGGFQYISSVTDKMDGTLFTILTQKSIDTLQKIKIVKKMLGQIFNILEDLQTKFNFTHNDLKSDNIFFKFKNSNTKNQFDPNNINFYIGDFDAATININGMTIIANPNLSIHKEFNNRKDLYLLLHSLYFNFYSQQWIDNFFYLFEMNHKTPGSVDEFHKLYRLKKDEIPEIYEVKNMKNYLIKLNFIES